VVSQDGSGGEWPASTRTALRQFWGRGAKRKEDGQKQVVPVTTMVAATTTDGDGWGSPGDLAHAVDSKENRNRGSRAAKP